MAVAFPQVFDLVPVFLGREGRDLSEVAQLSIGHLWLVTALLAFLVGCLAGNVATRHRPPGPFSTDLVRAARIVARVNLLLLLVTGAWIAVSAAKVGGLVPLILLSVADNLTARDILLDTKLFTGMRMYWRTGPEHCDIGSATDRDEPEIAVAAVSAVQLHGHLSGQTPDRRVALATARGPFVSGRLDVAGERDQSSILPASCRFGAAEAGLLLRERSG